MLSEPKDELASRKTLVRVHEPPSGARSDPEVYPAENFLVCVVGAAAGGWNGAMGALILGASVKMGYFCLILFLVGGLIGIVVGGRQVRRRSLAETCWGTVGLLTTWWLASPLLHRTDYSESESCCPVTWFAAMGAAAFVSFLARRAPRLTNDLAGAILLPVTAVLFFVVLKCYLFL